MHNKSEILKMVLISTTPPGNVDYTKAKYLATALLIVNDIAVSPAKNIIEFNNDFVNRYSREITNACKTLSAICALDVNLVNYFARIICQYRAMFHKFSTNEIIFNLDFNTALTLIDIKYPLVEFNETIFAKCMDIIVSVLPCKNTDYEAAVGDCILNTILPTTEDIRNKVAELDTTTKDKETLCSQTLALLHILSDVLGVSKDLKVDGYKNDNYVITVWKFVLDGVLIGNTNTIVDRALVLLSESMSTQTVFTNGDNMSNADRVMQVRMGTYV